MNIQELTKIKNTGIGSKYYRYFEDQPEPEIIRIYDVDEEKNIIKYYDKDNNKCKIDADELMANFKKLRADGILSLACVEVDGATDVMITLGVGNSSKGDTSMPYVVCRQCVYDFFTNNARKTDGVVYVGVSVSQETCPANIEFNFMLACNELKYHCWANVYLDDTIDDILRIVRTKRYDDVLRLLTSKAPMINNTKTVGYQPSVRELMENNNFMYDFHRAFDIYEVPSHIDPNAEELDLVNILFLENELKVNIMETYLIPYTREVDLKTIKRRYVMVTSAADKFDKVYIAGYDVADGEYVRRGAV